MSHIRSGVVNGVKGRAARESVTMLGVAALLIALLAGLAMVGKSRAASPLEKSFGKGGKIVANVRTDRVARDGHVRSLDVLPDGKILIAVQVDPDYTGSHILRLNPNGHRDASFRKGGSLIVEDGQAVEALPGGGFVVAGTIGEGTPGKDIAVRRYRPDGSLDRSFGKKGLYRRNLLGEDQLTSMALTSDGRIVVAARSFCPATKRICGGSSYGYDWMLSISGKGRELKRKRIEATRTVDDLQAAEQGTVRGWISAGETASTGGTEYVSFDRDLKHRVLRGFPATPDFGPTALLPDGGGYALSVSSIPDAETSRVVKLKPDANIDATFGAGGETSCMAGPSGSDLTRGSIQFDSEGRVLAHSPNGGCFLFRVLPEGRLDPSFGDGGIVKASGDLDDGGWKVASGPAGRTLLAKWQGRPGKLVVRRLSEDGRIDTTFGRDGEQTIVIEQPSMDSVAAVAAAPGGGMFLAGSAVCEGFNDETLDCQRFALQKRTAKGRLDKSFSFDGQLTARFMAVSAMASTKAGEIVLGGTDGPARTHALGTRPGFTLSKYKPGGKLDRSFGDLGVVSTRIGTDPGSKLTARILAVAIQPDGKIVATGETEAPRGQDEFLPVVRYNADGSLDSAFAEGGIAHIDLTEIERGRAVQVLRDGKILVAGRDRHDAIAVKLTADGRLDPSFGKGGIARPAIGNRSRWAGKPKRHTEEHEATSMAVLAGGGILLGTGDSYGGQAGAVVKLRANGRADRRFGKAGVAYTGGLSPNALTVDRCRRITVSGVYRRFANSRRAFAVTRLNQDGSGGRTMLPFGKGAPSGARAAVGLRGGESVVAGFKETSRTGDDFAIVALKRSGCR